jgi:hypothetical protein
MNNKIVDKQRKYFDVIGISIEYSGNHKTIFMRVKAKTNKQAIHKVKNKFRFIFEVKQIS